MKKLLFLIAIMMAMVACNSDKSTTKCDSFASKITDSITAAYAHVVDSALSSKERVIKLDSFRIDSFKKEAQTLKDSISILKNRPVLTDEIAAKAYSYERLHDYYIRCIKSTVKWKYYKGWSIRVFKVNDN